MREPSLHTGQRYSLPSGKNILPWVGVICYHKHGFIPLVSEYTTCQGGCSGTSFFYLWKTVYRAIRRQSTGAENSQSGRAKTLIKKKECRCFHYNNGILLHVTISGFYPVAGKDHFHSYYKRGNDHFDPEHASLNADSERLFLRYPLLPVVSILPGSPWNYLPRQQPILIRDVPQIGLCLPLHFPFKYVESDHPTLSGCNVTIAIFLSVQSQ